MAPGTMLLAPQCDTPARSKHLVQPSDCLLSKGPQQPHHPHSQLPGQLLPQPGALPRRPDEARQ